MTVDPTTIISTSQTAPVERAESPQIELIKAIVQPTFDGKQLLMKKYVTTKKTITLRKFTLEDL